MPTGAYQEPPLDPEHLVTSVVSQAGAQLRSKQIADSVLVKAMKVRHWHLHTMHLNTIAMHSQAARSCSNVASLQHAVTCL